jgi:hypothetical protein
MTAGGSLTNANWPASRPAIPLRALRSSPEFLPALPRANCAPPCRQVAGLSPTRRSSAGERDVDRLRAASSRAGVRFPPALPALHPAFSLSGRRLRPSSFNDPLGGWDGRPHSMILAGRRLASFVAPARFLRLANEKPRAGDVACLTINSGFRSNT